MNNISKIPKHTGYGHPERAFFFENLKFLGLGRHFGLNFSEAFGVFSAKLSAPIWVQFNYSTFISTKKLSLYIHISNMYSGLGVEFEFGP